MSVDRMLLIAVLLVQAIQVAWLVVLTTAWLRVRHHHDRLTTYTTRRFRTLTTEVQKAQRMRHPRTNPQGYEAAGPPTTVPRPAVAPPPPPGGSYGRHSR